MPDEFDGIKFPIYFSDLTPECQNKILKFYDIKNLIFVNWEETPIAAIKGKSVIETGRSCDYERYKIDERDD